MKSINDVRNTNAEIFSARTRSHLYKQWQRFTASDHSAFRIGIWGTTGAGKTTFLAMLYDALLLRPGWTVAADGKARTFVTSQLRNIRTKGRFPAPTEVTAETDIFRYILQEEEAKDFEGEFNQVTLDFVDAPGEFYERPHQADRRVIGEMDILDYLSSCHGIIFLLDPDRVDETLNEDDDDYRTMLLDLMLEFQERNIKSGVSDDLRLEQYMAFCITKTDKNLYWDQRNSPQNLVESVMGDTMYRMLGANFCKSNRYHFFATSSIGRYQDSETGEWLENVVYPGGKRSPSGRNGSKKSAITTTQIGESYEPEPVAAPTEPDTGPRAPRRSPTSSWAPVSDSGSSPRADYAPEVSIARKQAINPLNVIEPLDWLIENMRREPPRIMPQSKR
jgi:hypothetical protein